MTSTKALVNYIIEGIQDKKGHAIVTADLTQITSAPCQYFIICTGNSPQQVEAIAESIGDSARIKGGEKPTAVCGLENAEWVAIDYGTVMVHIFLPEKREYYDLEHLWDDATLISTPDID